MNTQYIKLDADAMEAWVKKSGRRAVIDFAASLGAPARARVENFWVEGIGRKVSTSIALRYARSAFEASLRDIDGTLIDAGWKRKGTRDPNATYTYSYTHPQLRGAQICIDEVDSVLEFHNVK